MPGHIAEHLVVDTTAFIKNKNLQDTALNIYTVQGVIDEITNKRQLRNLVVLPFDLKVKNAFPENVKFVTDFSKKTGDYTSLSAVDIQVMALAYQLEKEHVGADHLHTEPQIQRVAQFTEQLPPESLKLAGFYMPPDKGSFIKSDDNSGKHYAPEEVEEEGMKKGFKNLLKAIFKNAPGDTEEEEGVRLNFKVSAAPGDTEEDAEHQQIMKMTQVNVAPEDVEEAVRKPIPKYAFCIPRGPDERGLGKLVAPEDVEEDAVLKAAKVKPFLASAKPVEKAPEDVEEDAIYRLIHKVYLFVSRKPNSFEGQEVIRAPEDVEEEAKYKPFLLFNTKDRSAPEDVEEDSRLKSSAIRESQKVKVAPEDTEEPTYKLQSSTYMKSSYKQLNSKGTVNAAPEDVEEEGMYQLTLELRPGFTGAPGDVEEEAAYEFVLNQAHKIKSNRLAPEEVEEEAAYKCVLNKSLRSGLLGKRLAPEEVEEEGKFNTSLYAAPGDELEEAVRFPQPSYAGYVSRHVTHSIFPLRGEKKF